MKTNEILKIEFMWENTALLHNLVSKFNNPLISIVLMK